MPTIGYGHTFGVTADDVGVRTITEEEADRLLREEDLPHYERAVTELVTVPLTQGQADALIDFAYNLGARSLANSTLLRKLNNGDYQGAADEFPRWIYAGHEVLPGLVKRRAGERAMFLGDDDEAAS